MTELDAAALDVGTNPCAETYAALGAAHARLRQFTRAIPYLDKAFRMGVASKLSPDEQGFLFSSAAVAYAAVGRIDDALDAIVYVPRDVRLSDAVRPTFVPCFKEVQTAAALHTVTALWRLLVWNDEPLKAQALLQHCAPAVVEESPVVASMRELNDRKLEFSRSWKEYQDCYNGLDPHAYDPYREDAPEVRSFGRMILVRQWAESVAKDGDAIRILSIGPQDCVLERDLLAMNPRFHVTVTDASSLARGAFSALATDFPWHVGVWWTRDGFYDWPRGPFDIILCLEVIEHLPDQAEALQELRKRLSPLGTLILSTPCAGCWTNQRLTEDPDSHAHWGHLHANSKESLARKIAAAGLSCSIDVIDDGLFLFAQVRRADR